MPHVAENRQRPVYRDSGGELGEETGFRSSRYPIASTASRIHKGLASILGLLFGPQGSEKEAE
jgi:hypothetical protein